MRFFKMSTTPSWLMCWLDFNGLSNATSNSDIPIRTSRSTIVPAHRVSRSIYWACKVIQMSFIWESTWTIMENKAIICCQITVCSGYISTTFNIAVWWLRLGTTMYRLTSVPYSGSIWFKLLLPMSTKSVPEVRVGQYMVRHAWTFTALPSPAYDMPLAWSPNVVRLQTSMHFFYVSRI